MFGIHKFVRYSGVPLYIQRTKIPVLKYLSL